MSLISLYVTDAETLNNFREQKRKGIFWRKLKIFASINNVNSSIKFNWWKKWITNIFSPRSNSDEPRNARNIPELIKIDRPQL